MTLVGMRNADCGTRNAWASLRIPCLLVFALSAFLFFHKLADRDLWSSHEARAGMDAQSVLEDGSWLVPHLYDGRPELQKPPLYYWLTAALGWLRGGVVDAWTVRLPAALAALACVAAVMALGWLRGRPVAGLLAGAILASAAHFTWLARIGRIDMPLTLTVTTAVLGFYLARRGWRIEDRELRIENRGSRIGPLTPFFLLLGAYLSIAAGLLLKGPIGVVLPVAVVGLHLLVEGHLRFRWRKPRHFLNPRSSILDPRSSILDPRSSILDPRSSILDPQSSILDPQSSILNPQSSILSLRWGVPLVLVLTLPWFLWANAWTDGELFQVFFWHHNFERGFGGSRLRGHPWWFYGPQFVVDFLPWSPLLILAFIWWARHADVRLDPEARFGLAWFAAVLFILSCVRFKRADYLLPAYPGVALFLGCVLEKAGQRFRWPGRVALVSLVGVLCLFMVGVWTWKLECELPRQEEGRDYRSFAASVRREVPLPRTLVFFRTEAHALAFHSGRPLAILVEWDELKARLAHSATSCVVMPAAYLDEATRRLPGLSWQELTRHPHQAGPHHERPLVLVRVRKDEE